MKPICLPRASFQSRYQRIDCDSDETVALQRLQCVGERPGVHHQRLRELANRGRLRSSDLSEDRALRRLQAARGKSRDGSVGLDPKLFGTHSLRRTKATLIYRRTGNLRAVQLLLGHTKIESTVRYLGIEVDDGLAIAEQVDV